MSQIVHSMGVNAHDYGRSLRNLLWPRGLTTRCEGPIPGYPVGMGPVAMHPDCGSMGIPQKFPPLDDEHVIPLALVFDCEIKTSNSSVYQAETLFCPYWITPVLVMPEGKPDTTIWRQLTTLEAVCLLCQNPWLHWLTYFSTNCDRNQCIAYYYNSRIVVKCAASEYRGKHTCWTPWSNNSPDIRMDLKRPA